MEKKRILLTTSAAPEQSPFSTAEKRMPIGIGFLISVLRNAGHEVYFIDNYLKPSDFLETGYLIDNKIDFVGIYANTICFRDTLRMLKVMESLRQQKKWDGKIILGGPHTTVATDTIPNYVDFVVQGEGEKAIIDIVEGRVSQRIVRYPQIENLDELPSPAWDVFAKMDYKWDMEWFDQTPVYNMNTSRSCPFNCSFCSVRSIWGKKYTYFSAERVVDDIQDLIENYGAKGIYFREDNFTLHRKRLRTFCELMVERKLNIPWACESRVSTIDEESIEMMVKAGVKGFYFGVESGSQRILDLINKDITVEQIKKAFELCNKYNVKTAASMIVGIPGETEDDIKITQDLLNEIKPTIVWPNIFVGMPDSELYRQVLKERRYELIDDRGLVYLQGHNKMAKRFYGGGPFGQKAMLPGNLENLDSTDKPLISVLICVYNGERFIRETLESIYNQRFQDFEVIIVDDCSSDSTPEILREMKDARTFIYRNSENLGPCKSANIGLGLCRGEYIVRSDADDISVSDRFEKQLKVLQQQPELVAVGSWVQWIDEKGEELNTWKPVTEPEQIHNRLMISNAVAHGSSMIRMAALKQIMGYDESYKYSLDYDLWLRLSEVGGLRNIPEPLYKLRSWGGSISASKSQEQDRLAKKALEAACRRRKYPMVTVVSVNYNTIDFIKLCVEKVIECGDLPFEIIVVDNGSTDGSREFLKSQKGVRLIELDKNIGHGPALDLAMKYVRTKYVIVMDSDAHPIDPNWMSRMIEPINNETAASGIYHHRNYVHPACMAMKLEDFFNYQMTFKPNWPNDDDINKLGKTHWDAGEYVSMQLLKAGKKLHYFKLSNKPVKSIIGSEYGGIVYHQFYGTRVVLDKNRDKFDCVTKDDILNLQKSHFKEHKSKLNQTIKENKPILSVVLTTYNRHDLLEKVLEGFSNQDCSKNDFEVVVVDDGSSPKSESIVDRFRKSMNIVYLYQNNSGLAAARNNGISCANGEIILFSDDDDIPSPQLISEHIVAHQQNPDEAVAVLGHLDWQENIKITPMMDYVTGVGGEYFGYSRMQHGQFYDVWKWWGGLISAKKSLLNSLEGPFDTRLRFGYEDTELACRMLNRNIRILYNANAKSYILRPINFKEFCERRIKQGRALYIVAQKHPEIINKRYGLENAEQIYNENYRGYLSQWSNKIIDFENQLQNSNDPEKFLTPTLKQALYTLYKECFFGFWLQGYLEQAGDIKSGKLSLNDSVNKSVSEHVKDFSVEKLDVNNSPKKHITFVSSTIPFYDVGSSNVRVHQIVKILIEKGYLIDFVYYNVTDCDCKYIEEYDGKVRFSFVPMFENNMLNHFSRADTMNTDCLWMTNLWHKNDLKVAKTLVDHFISVNPSTKIIADTMDFHYKKYLRKYQITGDLADQTLANGLLEYENIIYPQVDTVTVVTQQEKQDINKMIDCNVDIIPNIHEAISYNPDYNQRKNICFIGSMKITHNKDAVIWFISKVLPLILKQRGDIRFDILGYGNEPFQEMLEKNPCIRVIGFVENAEIAMANYREFVCPLTYGAGMKGKIGSAAVAGTPVVSTGIGREGFDLVDGRDCFIADDPEIFAQRCIELYDNRQIWQQFSDNAKQNVLSKYSPQAVAQKIENIINQPKTAKEPIIN